MSLIKTLAEDFPKSSAPLLPPMPIKNSFAALEVAYYALSDEERKEMHKTAWARLKQMAEDSSKVGLKIPTIK